MGTTWAAIIKTKEHRAQSAKLSLRSNLQCASNPIALFFFLKGDVLSCLLLIRIMVRSTYVSIRGDLIFLLYTQGGTSSFFFLFIHPGDPVLSHVRCKGLLDHCLASIAAAMPFT